MRDLNKILHITGECPDLRLGKHELEGVQQRLEGLRAKMEDLADYSVRFNRYFSKEGWLAYGHFHLSTLKRAVEEYETNGSEAASAVILEYYDPDNIEPRLSFLNRVEELRVRRRLINLALVDYRAARHHAVVPLLLMVIDGAVNDAVGKGFHAQSLDLDVWDSLTAADGAINDIKSIFQQSRRKTRTDRILLPYRNGILHGMDLGYDNEIVSAKAWCFLFVIADWIADKKTEDQRREKLATEEHIPSLPELFEQVSETQRVRAEIDAWSARRIGPEQLQDLNRAHVADPGTPEETVIQFLSLWNKGNYGGMAKLYYSRAKSGSGRDAGDVRRALGCQEVQSFLIEDIEDQAACISEIGVTINPESLKPHRYVFRMIYESEAECALVRGLPGGAWRVVWVQAGRQV